MTINHHPDDATILAYAAGTLDEGFAVLVSCHLETCPHCRDTLKTAEMIGGAALETAGDAPVAEGSFGRLLERISASDATSGSPVPGTAKDIRPDRTTEWQKLPAALQNYMDGTIDNIDWKRAGPGVWQKPVKLSETASTSMRLLRIAPGRSVPEHGHGGQEMTLIICGAYEDEIGHFGPGDVADLDEHVEHQPRVISGEDCICLAVTEAPTRFKGFVSRLLQPLIGI